jgi:hypothetical protein
MRMFQNHGSPSKVLDVEYEVIEKPKGFDVVKPITDILVKPNE